MAEFVTCFKCGIYFGVPEHWLKSRRGDKESFWCPNGHSQAFVESEADRLRRERDRLKQDAARLNDELAAERKRAEDAERKTVQMRRRAAAGVCPCCNRTFLNVQRHMKTKHSNVVPLEQKTG